ncbi:hypothetical protein CL634_01380 [bacterium]|nr:hypothetical protein [bacterium]
MRLDHIAYRVDNRHKTAKLLKRMFDYKIGIEFCIDFDDGSKAECIAMTPSEKDNPISKFIAIPWVVRSAGISKPIEHHIAPEIFISDGAPGSIVGDWVKLHNGGGIHHVAYMTSHILDEVSKWKKLGVGFLTNDIIDCPEDGLRQIFTQPLPELGGIIVELIERGDKGFCQSSVKHLMNSTKGL